MGSGIKMVLLLVLTNFVWSTGFISIKYVCEYLEPIHIMTIRMIPPLLIFGYAAKKMGFPIIRREDYKWLLLMTLLDPITIIGLQSYGLKLTTASQSGMIFACMPMAIALFAWIFFKEKIRKKAIFGIVTAIIGVSLIVFIKVDTSFAPNPLLGNTLAFISMLCAVFYAMIIKRLRGYYTPYFLLFAQALISTVIQTPFFLANLPSSETPISLYFIVIYVGLFSICFGYVIYNQALVSIKAAYISLLQTLFPVFIMLLGHIVFHERLSALQYFGSVIVVLGSIIAGMPEKVSNEEKQKIKN